MHIECRLVGQYRQYGPGPRAVALLTVYVETATYSTSKAHILGIAANLSITEKEDARNLSSRVFAQFLTDRT